MNEGLLVPKRSLVSGTHCPEREISCEIISSIEQSSIIVLKAAPGMLEKASLDALYDLRFTLESEEVKTEGRLLRRDQSSQGDIILFDRINGLYRLSTSHH